MAYILTIVISTFVFAVGLIFIKYLVKFRKFSDVDFPFLIFILYFIEIVLLLVEVGFENWNYLTLLPLGNIGPFIFFTLPFLFLLPKNIRRYYLTLVALLAPAMLVYGIMRGVTLVIAGTRVFSSYVLDIICHFLCALYGVYLVRSEQVDFDVKTNIISGAVILGVALLMLILNAIFHTSFFGLSVYGKHNLYNVIFLKSAVLSIFLYFIVVAISLVFGYFFQKYLLLATQNGFFGFHSDIADEEEQGEEPIYIEEPAGDEPTDEEPVVDAEDTSDKED